MTTTSLRRHFPIFNQPANAAGGSEKDTNWIYFDSAATSQKPDLVLNAISDFYLFANANVHRASHDMARDTTKAFEQVRLDAQAFINSQFSEEIIWTKGATESINLVANGLEHSHLKPGDHILVSATEHHANIVPWQQLASRKGLQLDVIPVDENGCWKVEEGLQLINEKTALVAMGQVSNALGNINPIETFIKKAQKHGALTLIDGAQATAHLPIDVQALGCDFYVFSGHKMFAPTGIGVLYGKKQLLESMAPYQFGGEMIEKVSFDNTTFQPLPFKFEAGTPNIEGVLGLGAAIGFIQNHRAQIKQIETQLYQKLVTAISKIDGVRVWGDKMYSGPVLSFSVNGIDNQDLGILLNQQNIAVRVGHHCAMPLMESLGISGTVRISLACYNTGSEIDRFIEALANAIDTLRQGLKTIPGVTGKAQSPRSSDFPLADKIRKAKGWDQIYREVMLAGKQLQRLGPEAKNEQSEVVGCESQVWLQCTVSDGRLILQGDSPSKIVRGLLAVLFEPLQSIPVDQLADFNHQQYLESIGLARHLSPSRGNGLAAVVVKIQSFCQRVPD